jgi:hypothetical protein
VNPNAVIVDALKLVALTPEASTTPLISFLTYILLLLGLCPCLNAINKTVPGALSYLTLALPITKQ